MGLRPGKAWATASWLSVLPTLAWASGGAEPGHEGSGNPLFQVVVVLLLVGGAYLSAHFVFERVQRKFLVVSGAEYILLGLLLGPQVSALTVFDDLDPLAPIVALAVGWIGLLYGVDLKVRSLLENQAIGMRLALVDGAISAVMVGAVAWWALPRLGIGGDPEVLGVSALVLGCTAAAGSSSAVDLVAHRERLTEGLVVPLREAGRLSDILAMNALGLVVCIYHDHETLGARPPTAVEWAVISVALGGVLGLLFNVFLGKDESENSRFLALVGIISFASGASFYLRLSPLFVNGVLGTTLVNTSPHGEAVSKTLLGTLRPASLVLLVFAGAWWSPPTWWMALLGLALYVLVRLVAKMVGGWLAAVGTPLRWDLGRGRLAQGEAVLAMAVSYRLVYEGPVVDLVYTVLLGGIVLHEWVAPFVVRALLVDAGDLQHSPLPPAIRAGVGASSVTP